MNINYVKRSYNIDVSSKEKNAVVYLLITVFKLRSNVRVFVCFFLSLQTARYSALILGVVYGKMRYSEFLLTF